MSRLHFLHILYPGSNNDFVGLLLGRLWTIPTLKRRLNEWEPGNLVSDLGLALTTKLHMVELCRKRCNKHLLDLEARVAIARKYEDERLPGQTVIQLDDPNIAFEVAIDFDSVIFELQSACELLHKFVKAFLRFLEIERKDHRDFSEMLRDFGLAKDWYENKLRRRARNPFAHATAPWPTFLVNDEKNGHREFALAQGVEDIPNSGNCISLSDLSDIYRNFKKAEQIINERLLAEIEKLGRN